MNRVLDITILTNPHDDGKCIIVERESIENLGLDSVITCGIDYPWMRKDNNENHKQRAH